jgi:integrase
MEFEYNINQWYNDFYNKHEITQSDKAKLSYIYISLNSIFDELNIEEDNKNINKLLQLIKENSIDIEKAFYSIFKKMIDKKSYVTIKSCSSVCRKVLSDLGMDKNRLKIPTQRKEKKEKKEKKENIEMPINLTEIGNNDKLYIFIADRFKNIKSCSRCKSIQTQKILLRYWINLLKGFGDLKILNPDNIDLSIKNIVEKVNDIVVNNYYVIYLYHLFNGITKEWEIKLKDLRKYFNFEKQINNEEDGDKHTLSPKQQEDMIKVCTTSLEKLVILLLFTTGLRVGGLANIKINNVYDKKTKEIKDMGSTIEKGSKIRKFPIFELVKSHLQNWIDNNHAIETEYLFPHKNDHNKPKTTMFFQQLFKNIAKKAGYEGEEIHIHSARHSVAHNLMEAGNKLEDIGKFLGHSNPATTAKFYTKLSAEENIKKMNTACIGGINYKDKRIPQLPNFNIIKEKSNKKSSITVDKLKNMDIGDGKSIKMILLERKLEKERRRLSEIK